jgi:hypothetical protein
MTPFEALYGYEPPHLPMRELPSSKVQVVDKMFKERYNSILQLKEQLHKAQEKIKLFANRKRHERHLSVGDWVYLRLQSYRQISVQRRSKHKLDFKYYGPFEIIEKMRTIAYKLNLPDGSQMHMVFHVYN